MTPTEEFATIPEPIQEQLILVARHAAGMSTRAKLAGQLTLTTAALTMAMSCDDDDDALDVAEMVGACGVILTYADDYARPDQSGMVL